MSKFFAFLNRMKYIERWSLMRSTVKENIMEHSEQVAVIAYALGVIGAARFQREISPDRLCALGVFHESSEVLTGDLPTPIKYFNPQIKEAYRHLEEEATDKLLKMIEEDLRPYYERVLRCDQGGYEYRLLKAADKIAAYIKCVEEIKAGNSEFKKAQESIRGEIEAMKLGEADYFMTRYIDAFFLTLDELD